jgi:pyruvate dehydrogenase E2 component (dihydrolipoamide acetyltransferase)
MTVTTPKPPPATKAARLQTFSMPDVGEGLTEAEVLSWHVAVGDSLTVNQVMVEIETAKAAVELPSPFAGRVHALLVEPGVTVEVGTPIITVDTDPGAGEIEEAAPPAAPGPDTSGGSAGANGGERANGDGAKIGEVAADGRIATLVGYTSATAATTRRQRRDATGAPTPQPVRSAASVEVPPVPGPSPAPLATPPVRKLAKDLGIDLRSVRASRPDGVISRTDVENASAATTLGTDQQAGGDRELRIPVKGIRKATAAAMVASAFTAPHVTEFLTIDVTPMMELRDRLRQRPEFADVKLTPLAFAARAVCLAARRTPELNATFESGTDGLDDHIVVKRYVNLGIAAATPRGLIVPVIRDAETLDLAGLAAALQDLTATARDGHTTLAQMTGGTFTITNVGVFGVDTGTPIINPGEAAILALGSIKDAPWVVDGRLAVRKVCQLALSFDHRVVDGQQGSQFLADVGALLADPGLALAF